MFGEPDDLAAADVHAEFGGYGGVTAGTGPGRYIPFVAPSLVLIQARAQVAFPAGLSPVNVPP